MKKSKLYILIICIISICLSACSDKTETDDRRYVVLMGLDSGKMKEQFKDKFKILGEKGKYILSLGEASLESDIGKEKENKKMSVVLGDTIAEMRRIEDKYSDKETYFGQLKVAILGRDLISNSDMMIETVNAMERMEDINTRIVVLAADSSAADVVEKVMKKDSKGGLYLWDYYRNNEDSIGNSEYMDFEDLAKNIRQESTFIIPKILLKDDEIFTNGAVVMTGNKYIDDISEKETKANKWINGEARGEIITFKDTTVRVKRQTAVKSEKDGSTVINISAYCAVESGEIENLEYLQNELEKVIKNDLENTINKVKNIGADFTSTLCEDCEDVIINVNIKITSTGVIK